MSFRLARPAEPSQHSTDYKSNGRLAAQGLGQDTADFFGTTKAAAWNSQPCADTDQRAAECTQRWVWNVGNHYCQNPKGLSLMAVWVAVSVNTLQANSQDTTGTSQPLLKPAAWSGRPWWTPVARIGEAKNPGPLVCTCNSAGWSRAEGLLSMGHDLILMQETFLLQPRVAGVVPVG
eukprot:2675675-Amphidinium_carterae.1